MYVVCNPRWNRVRVHNVFCCQHKKRRPNSNTWSEPFGTKEAAWNYATRLERPDTEYAPCVNGGKCPVPPRI